MNCIVNVRDPLGPKIIICAHRIETRVHEAGETLPDFSKNRASQPLHLLETQPKGWRVSDQVAR